MKVHIVIASIFLIGSLIPFLVLRSVRRAKQRADVLLIVAAMVNSDRCFAAETEAFDRQRAGEHVNGAAILAERCTRLAEELAAAHQNETAEDPEAMKVFDAGTLYDLGISIDDLRQIGASEKLIQDFKWTAK